MDKYSRITNNPPTLSQPLGLYSQVCTVNSSNLIFLAGQVAVDEYGDLVGNNDISAQVNQIYKNIGDALHSANATFENIVQFTTYIVGSDNIPAFLEKRNSIVNNIYPLGDFPPKYTVSSCWVSRPWISGRSNSNSCIALILLSIKYNKYPN